MFGPTTNFSFLSGSSLAPHDSAYNVWLQLASLEEVAFRLSFISKELDCDQVHLLINSKTSLTHGNMAL
jgi:hypothetical protein